MGFTRYFPRTRNFTQAEWDAITKQVETGLKPYQNILTPQIINKDYIEFNGLDDHETFKLYRELPKGGIQFCKTARKPYDEAVCVVLLACVKACPDVLEIMSD